jgi:acylphosphatase
MRNDVATRFIVTGLVQGVGYRYFAWRAAQALGIRGYVRNRDDGSVEAYAVGPADRLRQFRDELARGPLSAEVEQIQESPEAPDPALDTFEIWH